MEYTNTLTFSDTELKHLYDILLSTKLTASAQEILLVRMGKTQSPVLDLTLKVAQVWETRALELQKEQSETKLPEVTLGGETNV